jgi:hypothetical protein
VGCLFWVFPGYDDFRCMFSRLVWRCLAVSLVRIVCSNGVIVTLSLFGRLVDGMKRMDVVFDSCCFCSFVAHTVLFRVMNQFEAAQDGDLQQLRVALTVDNVNAAQSVDVLPLSSSAYTSTIEHQ